jgi:hypothetical protein
LGPRSKSVLIQKTGGAPIVCNDGVTIAKEFELKDPEENLSAHSSKYATIIASNMPKNNAGNGTKPKNRSTGKNGKAAPSAAQRRYQKRIAGFCFEGMGVAVCG